MTTPNANEDTEKLDHPHFAGRSVKWYTLENGLEIPSKTKNRLAIQLSNRTLRCISEK